MFSKLIAFSALLGVALSQSYGCDHYSVYPTDTCFTITSSSDLRYVCNGTDIAQYQLFDAGDCEAGEDPTYTFNYDISNSGSSAECDQGGSCGYFAILADDILSYIIITDVCYDFTSSSSFEYSCSGSKLTYNLYTEEDDCSGSKTSSTVDMSEYYSGSGYTVMYFISIFIYYIFFFN